MNVSDIGTATTILSKSCPIFSEADFQFAPVWRMDDGSQKEGTGKRVGATDSLRVRTDKKVP